MTACYLSNTLGFPTCFTYLSMHQQETAQRTKDQATTDKIGCWMLHYHHHHPQPQKVKFKTLNIVEPAEIQNVHSETPQLASSMSASSS